MARRKYIYFRKKDGKWHIKPIASSVSLCGSVHMSTFDESRVKHPKTGVCKRCRRVMKEIKKGK